MKKLFLTIGIFALVIVMIAAIFALLSLFELAPFFSRLANIEREPYPPDQATIMVGYVDSLDNRQFQVEEVWLVYIVTSRMDTAIIQEAYQAEISPNLFQKSFTQSSLTRRVSANENIDIDYVFLVDGIGRVLINNLLENQQSSINLNDSTTFCEILSSNEMQMFDLYLQYANGHVRSTISAPLIAQLAINENFADSLYCESIEP